jgi:peptidoglycan hydrolase-like protein with peptidoglycan-binding domain
MSRRAAALAGLLAAALSAASCSQPPQAQKHPTAPVITPSASVPKANVSVAVPDPDLLTDERAVLAAQRALAQLGYNTGKADGVNGPATRRAVQAFQKDRGLAEDGRLTVALAKMLGSLAAQIPNATPITVAAGDSIIYSDGSVDSAGHDRVVPWDQEGSRALVAVRPSTRGWPPAARAGLDWATTHALDDGAAVQWSSTGVQQQFDIRVFTQLTSREAALAGGGASCRRFELRTEDSSRRYPGLACKDARGDWVLPHTRIHLARPATALGSQAEAPSH